MTQEQVTLIDLLADQTHKDTMKAEVAVCGYTGHVMDQLGLVIEITKDQVQATLVYVKQVGLYRLVVHVRKHSQ